MDERSSKKLFKKFLKLLRKTNVLLDRSVNALDLYSDNTASDANKRFHHLIDRVIKKEYKLRRMRYKLDKAFNKLAELLEKAKDNINRSKQHRHALAHQLEMVNADLQTVRDQVDEFLTTVVDRLDSIELMRDADNYRHLLDELLVVRSLLPNLNFDFDTLVDEVVQLHQQSEQLLDDAHPQQLDFDTEAASNCVVGSGECQQPRPERHQRVQVVKMEPAPQEQQSETAQCQFGRCSCQQASCSPAADDDDLWLPDRPDDQSIHDVLLRASQSAPPEVVDWLLQQYPQQELTEYLDAATSSGNDDVVQLLIERYGA